MKKLIFTLILSATLSLLIISCKKSNDNHDNHQPVKVTLRQNQSYSLDLGLIGIEDAMTISKQASHFEVSSLKRDSTTAKIIYMYKPTLDFVGSDLVELKWSMSNGAVFVKDSLIQLSLTITK